MRQRIVKTQNLKTRRGKKHDIHPRSPDQSYDLKNMNHNAPHKKHSAARHRWQDAIFNKDRLPEAYTWSAETTPGGTAFQRVIRTDTGRTGRVLLYFHGGGLTGTAWCHPTAIFSTGFFQAANGCETIYLDYRCAPDYQYPTQLNEALDLWDNLTKRQGYAPDQIILGGDSAGANLALALLLKLRDLNKTIAESRILHLRLDRHDLQHPELP